MSFYVGLFALIARCDVSKRYFIEGNVNKNAALGAGRFLSGLVDVLAQIIFDTSLELTLKPYINKVKQQAIDENIDGARNTLSVFFEGAYSNISRDIGLARFFEKTFKHYYDNVDAVGKKELLQWFSSNVVKEDGRPLSNIQSIGIPVGKEESDFIPFMVAYADFINKRVDLADYFDNVNSLKKIEKEAFVLAGTALWIVENIVMFALYELVSSAIQTHLIEGAAPKSGEIFKELMKASKNKVEIEGKVKTFVEKIRIQIRAFRDLDDSIKGLMAKNIKEDDFNSYPNPDSVEWDELLGKIHNFRRMIVHPLLDNFLNIFLANMLKYQRIYIKTKQVLVAEALRQKAQGGKVSSGHFITIDGHKINMRIIGIKTKQRIEARFEKMKEVVSADSSDRGLIYYANVFDKMIFTAMREAELIKNGVSEQLRMMKDTMGETKILGDKINILPQIQNVIKSEKPKLQRYKRPGASKLYTKRNLLKMSGTFKELKERLIKLYGFLVEKRNEAEFYVR